MSAPPHDPSRDGDVAPGVSLSSYELLGKLARGGMGTVYVARRAGAAGFQRLFAIKLMHEHLADHEEFVQMFLDEARLAARLHHPNVVAIVDVGEVDGRQFVVMDYIEGCSLGQLFKLSPAHRPVKSVASIFNEFLLGLHAAHELRDDDGQPLNLVHRDVSPQNVLVGLDGVARITDFGIAKAEARLTSTRPGLRKGKLAFMAPEQLYDKALDRRADIFAAGAILWSALTGEKLFSGSSDAATMRNLLQMEIKPPSEVGLKPPPVFDEVCLKALERDPGDRYSTAAEMVDAIRAAAMENGVLGTSSDVSVWVRDVAGAKIEDRRKALGSVSSDSAVRTIPVLVESPSQMHSALTGMSGLSRASAVPVGNPKRGRSTLLALLLIPLAVVFAVGLAVITHRPEEDPTATTERPTPSVSHPPEAPTSPAEGLGQPPPTRTEETEAPSPTGTVAVPAEPSPEVEEAEVVARPEARPRPQRFPLRNRNIARQAPAPEEPAAPEEPEPEAVPEAPEPPPEEAPAVETDVEYEYERNPYLRGAM